MSRKPQNSDKDTLRAEYDFSQGVRGKHHREYQAGTNVVFLGPDVAKVFRGFESLNPTLRLRLAKDQVPAR